MEIRIMMMMEKKMLTDTRLTDRPHGRRWWQPANDDDDDEQHDALLMHGRLSHERRRNRHLPIHDVRHPGP